MAQSKQIDLSTIAEAAGIDTRTARRRLRAVPVTKRPKSTAENRWRFSSKDKRRVSEIISASA